MSKRRDLDFLLGSSSRDLDSLLDDTSGSLNDLLDNEEESSSSEEESFEEESSEEDELDILLGMDDFFTNEEDIVLSNRETIEDSSQDELEELLAESQEDMINNVEGILEEFSGGCTTEAFGLDDEMNEIEELEYELDEMGEDVFGGKWKNKRKANKAKRKGKRKVKKTIRKANQKGRREAVSDFLDHTPAGAAIDKSKARQAKRKANRGARQEDRKDKRQVRQAGRQENRAGRREAASDFLDHTPAGAAIDKSRSKRAERKENRQARQAGRKDNRQARQAGRQENRSGRRDAASDFVDNSPALARARAKQAERKENREGRHEAVSDFVDHTAFGAVLKFVAGGALLKRGKARRLKRRYLRLLKGLKNSCLEFRKIRTGFKHRNLAAFNGDAVLLGEKPFELMTTAIVSDWDGMMGATGILLAPTVIAARRLNKRRIARNPKERHVIKAAKVCDRKYRRLTRIWQKLNALGKAQGLPSPRQALSSSLSWLKPIVRDASKIVRLNKVEKQEIKEVRRSSQRVQRLFRKEERENRKEERIALRLEKKAEQNSNLALSAEAKRIGTEKYNAMKAKGAYVYPADLTQLIKSELYLLRKKNKSVVQPAIKRPVRPSAIRLSAEQRRRIREQRKREMLASKPVVRRPRVQRHPRRSRNPLYASRPVVRRPRVQRYPRPSRNPLYASKPVVRRPRVQRYPRPSRNPLYASKPVVRRPRVQRYPRPSRNPLNASRPVVRRPAIKREVRPSRIPLTLRERKNIRDQKKSDRLAFMQKDVRPLVGKPVFVKPTRSLRSKDNQANKKMEISKLQNERRKIQAAIVRHQKLLDKATVSLKNAKMRNLPKNIIQSNFVKTQNYTKIVSNLKADMREVRQKLRKLGAR